MRTDWMELILSWYFISIPFVFLLQEVPQELLAPNLTQQDDDDRNGEGEGDEDEGDKGEGGEGEARVKATRIGRGVEDGA